MTNNSILSSDAGGVRFADIRGGAKFYTYVNGGVQSWTKLRSRLEVPAEQMMWDVRLFVNAVTDDGTAVSFNCDELVWPAAHSGWEEDADGS